MMRQVWIVLTLQALGGTAEAQGLYLQSASPISHRSAVLEDDGVVAYLFLCKPGTLVPEREVIAYSRLPPTPKIDWQWVKRTGEMAPISQDIATATAVIPRPAAAEFSFRWSKDGNAVALIRNGTPLAFAEASHATGHSKAVAKANPLGNPWNQLTYESIFGK